MGPLLGALEIQGPMADMNETSVGTNEYMELSVNNVFYRVGSIPPGENVGLLALVHVAEEVVHVGHDHDLDADI